MKNIRTKTGWFTKSFMMEKRSGNKHHFSNENGRARFGFIAGSFSTVLNGVIETHIHIASARAAHSRNVKFIQNGV